MTRRPVVFVSSTSADLRSCREAAKHELLRVECVPVTQEDFPPDHRGLPDYLRARIAESDAVFCLVGSCFGSWPGGQTVARRSFSQIEYDHATALGKPVFVFEANGIAITDPLHSEDEEDRRLQADYIDRLRRDHTCKPFTSPVDLQRQIAEVAFQLKGLHTPAALPPLDFRPELERNADGFVGREWLDLEVAAWLGDPAGRVLVVIGAPGIGKSAYAARLSRIHADKLAAVYFCSDRNVRTIDAFEFVDALVHQFSEHVPGFGPAVASSQPHVRRDTGSNAFRELIVQPLRSLPRPLAPWLVVIDSLDEAVRQGENAILDVLVNQIEHLPDWVRVVTTTRPDPRLIGRLERVAGIRRVVLSVNGEGNVADVAKFVDSRLRRATLVARLGPFAATTARSAGQIAGGSFLCARLILDAIEFGPLTAAEVSELAVGPLPTAEIGRIAPGLAAFYGAMLEKARRDPEWGEEAGLVVRALTVAAAPLSWNLLVKLTGAAPEMLRKRMRVIEPYLSITGRGTRAEYALVHPTLRDWLTDPDGAGDAWCESTSSHAMMADALMPHWQTDEYGSRHLLSHLIGAERWPVAAEVLGDLDTLQRLWDLDQYQVRAAWGRIERCSRVRLLDVYRLIIDEPSKNPACVRRLAWLLEDTNHAAEAERLHRWLVDYHRQTENLEELQVSLGNLGLLVQYRSQWNEALALHLEQEAICRSQEPDVRSSSRQVGLWKSLNNQGLIQLQQGHALEATQLWQEVDRIGLQFGDRIARMHSARNLGRLALGNTRIDESLRLLRRAEGHCRAMDQRGELPHILGFIFEILCSRGLWTDALSVVSEEVDIFEDLGHTARSEAGRVLHVRLREAIKGAGDELHRDSDATGLCEVLCTRGRLFHAVGDRDNGAKAFQTALAFLESPTVDKSRGQPRRTFIADYVGRVVRTQLHVFRYDLAVEALRSADRLLVSLMEPEPDMLDCYDLACISALTAKALAGLDTPELEVKRATCVNQGVARLHDALRAGYRNIQHLLQDEDLDELRPSAPYKSLVAEFIA